MMRIAHNLVQFATVMMSFFMQDWAKIVIPYSAAAVAITVCVAFSTFGAANGTLISGSRYELVHILTTLLTQNVDIKFHTGVHVIFYCTQEI